MSIGQLGDYGRFVPEAKRAVLMLSRPRADLESLGTSQDCICVAYRTRLRCHGRGSRSLPSDDCVLSWGWDQCVSQLAPCATISRRSSSC